MRAANSPRRENIPRQPLRMKSGLPIEPFLNEMQGEVRIPGSKSITNRALILSALTQGETKLKGCLFSEDTEIMCNALDALAIPVKRDINLGTICVQGNGGVWSQAEAELFVGNAGTTARFLTAMLCLHPSGCYQLDGTIAMRNRPMQGLLEALRKLGAKIICHSKDGHFPFTMETSELPGGIWEVDASQSSQILSALLMVAPLAKSEVKLHLKGETVSKPFVSMTLKMMQQFGAEIESEGLAETRISNTARYKSVGNCWPVEPDATAASYFLALPGVVGGEAFLPGLQREMLQGDIRFDAILKQVGYKTHFIHKGIGSTAQPDDLRGGEFDFNAISDTFLTLAAIAPLLKGETRITGIAHTRKQETDRINAMATELRRLGQRVEETDDSIHIFPNRRALHAKAIEGVHIETYDDHRVAMSFGILGSLDLRGDGSPWLTVLNPDCCSKTFPDFFEKLENLRQASVIE